MPAFTNHRTITFRRKGLELTYSVEVKDSSALQSEAQQNGWEIIRVVTNKTWTPSEALSDMAKTYQEWQPMDVA